MHTFEHAFLGRILVGGPLTLRSGGHLTLKTFLMTGPCWDSTWPHLVENACLTNGSVLFLMWTNKSARLERIVSVHSTVVDNNSIYNVAYQCFVNGGYPRFQCKPLYMYGYIILLCFSVQFELPFIIRLTKVVFKNITRWLCIEPLSQHHLTSLSDN